MENSQEIKLAVTLLEEKSGRIIEAYTSEPAIHLYTGNYLDENIPSKFGGKYFKRAGLCLEAWHFPDTPNHKNFPSILLNPGEEFKSSTIYYFKINH